MRRRALHLAGAFGRGIYEARLGARARRETVKAVTLAVGYGRRAARVRQESRAGR